MYTGRAVSPSLIPPASIIYSGELLGEFLPGFVSYAQYVLCTSNSRLWHVDAVGWFTGGCRRKRRRWRDGWAGGGGETHRRRVSGAATSGAVRAPCGPTNGYPRRSPRRSRSRRRRRKAAEKAGRRASCCGCGRPGPPACAPCGGCSGRIPDDSWVNTCMSDGS
jgi:hypothetical protein